jgi:hypothetical protein
MTDCKEMITSPEWDYTCQARYYVNRPNYAPDAIEHLCEYIGAATEDYRIADVGAGTANLTLMLADKMSWIYAVEPTQKKTEEIIRHYFPDYSHGIRREQQADVILESRLFNQRAAGALRTFSMIFRENLKNWII